MEYKASLDWPGRIITVSIFIMAGGIIYRDTRHIMEASGDFNRTWPQLLVITIMISTIVLCYLFAPRGYVLGNSDLTIKRPIGDVKIKYDDFEALTRIEGGGGVRGIRTFGVGGLFGYFGQFYLREYGTVTGYATKLSGRILIVTRQGNRIIITPDDEGFIDALKKKLSTQTYSLN